MPKIDATALEGDLLLRGVWEGLGTPECHLTGGYLRDRFLGRKSVDLDLVLPGTLENAKGPAHRLAARLDTRAHVLGRDLNRVWRVDCPEITVELWPLGDLDLEDDIKRRDFSCNALVWRLPDGPLDDRVRGLEDLESGVVRALSKENLVNDPVRLVRAARFLAQLEGFQIDPKTAVWIRSLATSLADAPRERVGHELLKLLDAPGAVAGLRALLELDLLESSAPPTAQCDRDWIERNLTVLSLLTSSTPHVVAGAVAEAGIASRLALILRAWGCPDADSLDSYAWPRSSRREAARAAALLELALRTVEATAAERRSFIHSAGTAFPATLCLAAAVEPDHPWDRWWRLWRERGRDLIHPEALLAGGEVADLLGIKPGPELGRAVEALTEAQVRGEVRTVGGAKAWLRKYLKD